MSNIQVGQREKKNTNIILNIITFVIKKKKKNVVPTCGRSPFYSLWVVWKEEVFFYFLYLEYNDMVLRSSSEA